MPLPGHQAERRRRFYKAADVAPVNGGFAVQLDGRWVLYDNVADPYQMKNLIQDPAQKDLIAKFDAALMAWSKSTGDNFPYEKALKSYSSYPGA